MPLPKKAASKKRPPIAVRAIDFVMYNTKSLRKTRAFYQRLFGFKKGGEWNDSWSEFKTEPITLCLNGTTKKTPPNRDWHGTPCVALAVEDVRAAIKACRQRRVKILIEPVKTSVCWMAWIADPAGNRICLHSRDDGTAG